MGKESSVVWFAKFLFKHRVLSLLAGKLQFQEATGKQDPVIKSLLWVKWRLTCALSSTGMRHSSLLIFKAKSRNLSTPELGNMEKSCDIALVPLSPSSLLGL